MTVNQHPIAEFNAIEVDTKVCSIEFIPSDHFGIEINSNSGSDISWCNENGQLVVKESHFALLKVSLVDDYMRIFFPQGKQFTIVNLRCRAGHVRVTNVNAVELNVLNDAGVTTIMDSTFSTLTMRHKAGGLLCTRVKAGTVTQNGNAGSAEFISMNADVLTARSDAGNISVRDCIVREMNATAKLGWIDCKQVTFDSLSARCSTGSINLEGSFKALDLLSDLGNVNVKLDKAQQDYSVELRTNLGAVSVNGARTSNHYHCIGTAGAPSMSARSKLGNINVNFCA